MKQKNGKKLRLAKETIQDLDNVLGWDQQKMVKGGSETGQSDAGTCNCMNTRIRVFRHLWCQVNYFPG